MLLSMISRTNKFSDKVNSVMQQLANTVGTEQNLFHSKHTEKELLMMSGLHNVMQRDALKCSKLWEKKLRQKKGNWQSWIISSDEKCGLHQVCARAQTLTQEA